MKIHLLYLLSIIFPFFLTAQETIYVSATGSGAMDGTSESNAYGNFGNAIDQINSEGDKLVVIGAIDPTPQNLSTKNFAFTIEGLDSNSVLGSSGTGRLFTINSATSANVTFKNLTFLNNNTTLAGGSVFFNNNAGATASFENCTFDGNSVDNAAGGGAIYFANGNLSISNCSFVNNSSTDEGGAIFGVSGTITITNTLFKSNSAASKGGALYANEANFTISGSTFYANKTTNTTAAGGSAFYVAGAGSNNDITNCTFFQNTTGNTNLDYGTIRTDNGNTSVTNSLFYDNKTNNNVGPISDWGSGPNGTQTFNTSLAQWISNNIDIQDEGTGSITAIKNGGGTAANLESSNLTFNETSGYVEYNAVYEGENSPIDFGSDGNDVGAWNSGLTLLLPDTTPPVITVDGDNPATVELGATYTDAGATADGGETVTTSGTVDTTTVGTYTITYSATDAAGNTGTATRTVNVVDTTAPVITLIGDASITLEVGAIYTEQGATATDNYDTNLTVVVGGDTVDTSTVGTYMVTYNVSDAAGNAAIEVTRTVIVEAALSVEEIDDMIRVYPNPVKDYVIIDTSEKALTKIFDIRGVMLKSTSNQKIDISEFSPGIYILKTETTTGKGLIKKLIKQ